VANEPAAPLTAPRWAVLSGAALAAVVATGVPGLAALLRSLGQSAPDVDAMVAEIPLALATAFFGAMQTRAQFRQAGRGIGVLLLFVNAAIVFFIGIGFVLHEAAGTVDGGPVLVIGAALVLGAAALQSAVAAYAWWAIARNVRDTRADGASGEGASRLRWARWLLWLSGLHVVLKLSSGGSVTYGVIGAATAAALALSARRLGTAATSAPLAISALVALVGFGIQAQAWGEMAHAQDLAQMPFCETADSIYNRETDVLAKPARSVAGVADAATDVSGVQVTVYVLPVGGGELDAATQAAVEKAITGVTCVFYDGHEYQRAEHVKVQGAMYANLDVTAYLNVSEQLIDGSQQKIVDAVHAILDLKKPGLALVRVPRREAWSDPETPGIGGWVDYRVGESPLREKVTGAPPGTVPIVHAVEVVAKYRDGGSVILKN
jgi:hypothetical protein